MRSLETLAMAANPFESSSSPPGHGEQGDADAENPFDDEVTVNPFTFQEFIGHDVGDEAAANPFTYTEGTRSEAGASKADGSPGNGKEKGWAEDTKCALCQSVFSKRMLNPRHHCRLCGNSVCGNCSVSQVQLEDAPGLQRACKQCVANAQCAPAIISRLEALGLALHGMSTETSALELAKQSINDKAGTLDAVTGRCESALHTLEDNHAAHNALKISHDALKGQLSEAQRDSRQLSEAQHRAQAAEAFRGAEALRVAAEARCSEAEGRCASLEEELRQAHRQSQQGKAAAPPRSNVVVESPSLDSNPFAADMSDVSPVRPEPNPFAEDVRAQEVGTCTRLKCAIQ